MQEIKQLSASTGSLFDRKKDRFLESFYPEISSIIISLLKKQGFFVVSYIDPNTNQRHILASTRSLNQFCANQFSNVNFISIEIKNGTQKNQKSYKNRILKSGGAYIGVHSLNDFYTQFKSITGEVL